MHPLGALLESIVGNPYEIAADFLAKVTKRPHQDVELLLRAVSTKDSLARIALAGLFLESTRPQCKTSLGPVDPMRDPSSGFTIRDISLVPAEPKVAQAHSLPDQPRAQVPSAVPVVIEVVSVGLEARPDLVGVVETALNDLPSESTQIIRAFVAGFRGYYDCPDPTNGSVVLSALLSQLLSAKLDSEEIVSGQWFSQVPWTAVMAAPLEQPTIGSIAPGAANFCNPQSPQAAFESKAVKVYPLETVNLDDQDELDEIIESLDAGSGDQPGSLTPIQNLWALAIPDAVYESINKLFFVKQLLKTRAAQVVYLPTAIDDPNDVRRFLGQLNFDKRRTWGDVAYQCACQGDIRAGTDLVLKLATLSVSDQDFLRRVLSDETMISLSSQLPLRIVPWDKRTELVPADLYVLKPIPGLGIALSMKVRIWQSNLDNFPFERQAAQLALYPSLRAVLSPCDVATFTPDPLLCVARSSRQTPGAQSSSVSSTANNQVQNVNAPSSSSAPAVTYYQTTQSNAQAAAAGPNIAQPGYIQVRAAEQAWTETEAPSKQVLVPGAPGPNAPPLTLSGYYTNLFPLGDMTFFASSTQSKPIGLYAPILPLPEREPLSIDAFLAWVQEKLFSFRPFRTVAQRQALVKTVPRTSQVYLGLIGYPLSATHTWQGSQYKPRQTYYTVWYRAYNRSFSQPTDAQVPLIQGQLRAQFESKP